LLTSRIKDLSPDIIDILKDNNMSFDKYIFKRWGYEKPDRIDELLEKFPNIEYVEVWDDRNKEIDLLNQWKDQRKDIDIMIHQIMSNRETIEEILNHKQTFYKPIIKKEEVYDALQWYDAYNDVYPGYSKEIEKNDKYFFDNKKEAEKTVEYINSIFESLPQKIAVYRAVKANSIKDVDINEFVGESWSFDLNSAKEFGNHAWCNFIISGFVNKSDIDLKKSAKLYVQNSLFQEISGEAENEIFVPFGTKIENLKVVPFKNAKEIAPHPFKS